VHNKGTNKVEQKLSDMTLWDVLYFAVSLPTDTAVPLSHGEDGLLRGESCTGQLNIESNVVSVVRMEYKNCDRLWKW
jgi:hypothetical protein